MSLFSLPTLGAISEESEALGNMQTGEFFD